MKKNMKTFTIVNDNDGNDTFDVKAKNIAEAAEKALDMLGWYITVGNSDKENANKES